MKRSTDLIKNGLFRDAMKATAKRRKPNPARKRKTVTVIKRAKVPAKRYVNRPSQISRKPPTKRLKARREKALDAPAGYFPNPASGFRVSFFNSSAGKFYTYGPPISSKYEAIENAKQGVQESGYAAAVVVDMKTGAVVTMVADTSRL